MAKQINIAALFDMDGVLIDSVKYHWLAMNEVLADYGLHVPDEELRNYIGQPLRNQIEQLSQHFKVTLDYDQFDERTNVRKQQLLKDIEPKEGARELLVSLEQANIPMAIATSNSRVETERRLDVTGIKHYFDALITEDDVVEHKPNPAVYLAAAQAVNSNPSNCVVFEDAPAGITAAKRAGMYCIAVRTLATTEADLTEADFVVSTLAELNSGLVTSLLVNQT